MYPINLLKYLHVHDVDPEVLWAQIEENCLLQTKNSFAKAAKLGSNIFCNSCNSRELHLDWTLLEKVIRHGKKSGKLREFMCSIICFQV